MEFEIINTHKKYAQKYICVNGQTYSFLQAFSLFEEEDLEEEIKKRLQEDSKLVQKKRYKYLRTKQIKKRIAQKKDEIISELKLEKAKNAYENIKIISTLLNFFIGRINTDTTIIEDRLQGLKHQKYELTQDLKQLERSYEKKVYNQDKLYKKITGKLKQIEKYSERQNTRMLFNTIVRKKSTNQEDVTAFVYLLNQLNIKAYQAQIEYEDKQNTKTHLVVLAPIKQKQNETTKYVVCDPTQNRFWYAHPTEKMVLERAKEGRHTVKLMGKKDLSGAFSNYKIVSLQDAQKAYYPADEQFKKTLAQLAQDSVSVVIFIKD